MPELKAKAKDGRALTLREAMQEHRANAICAGCHARMDPIGFALENFNGVGEWRSEEPASPIDVTGKLPGAPSSNGPAGLKKLLLESHRDEFIQTFTEKLLTYALGRSVGAADKPAVRAIARAAARDNYRVSAFLTAIIESRTLSNEEGFRKMIITKKALPRRTFLRGLGTTMALPFLDAMVPALAAAPGAPIRMAFVSTTRSG